MAGSKKDAFATDVLELIFTNANIANIGDATGLRQSTAAGNFYIALYQTAPTASNQGVECNYTGYARKNVQRDANWTVSGNNAYNTNAITFAQCSADSNTATSFAICLSDTEDTDDQIYWGDLTANLAISAGITPEFAAGDLDVFED